MLQVPVSRLSLMLSAAAAPQNLRQHVFQQLLTAHSMVPVITPDASTSASAAEQRPLTAHLLTLSCCTAGFPANVDDLINPAALEADIHKLQGGVQLDTDHILPRIMLLSACPASAQPSRWAAQFNCIASSAAGYTGPPVVELGLGLLAGAERGRFGAALVGAVAGDSWKKCDTVCDLLHHFPDVIMLEVPAQASPSQLLVWLRRLPQADRKVRIFLHFPAALPAALVNSPLFTDRRWDIVRAHPLAEPAAAQAMPSPAAPAPASTVLSHAQLLRAVTKHVFGSASSQAPASACQSRTHRAATLRSACLQLHHSQKLAVDHEQASCPSPVGKYVGMLLQLECPGAASAQGPASLAWLQSQHAEQSRKQLASAAPYAVPAQPWQRHAITGQPGAFAPLQLLQLVLHFMSIEDQDLRRAALLQLQTAMADPSQQIGCQIRCVKASHSYGSVFASLCVGQCETCWC